jgi:uncharacterized protein YbgA (DUF1722 family)/uncharacterized protein YbbK (DUF523 family)
MPERKNKISPIKIGISTCLLGQKVRFDGGHKRDRYITDILRDYFTFVPVCPELEIGMGVPREAVRLQGSVAAPRMVGSRTGKDWTAAMTQYVERRVRQRDLSDICGYILKKDSPSCGMERVKVYDPAGMPQRKATGLFAAALIKHHPLLPAEEEGRLNDLKLRENFIVRVFAFSRLRRLFQDRLALGKLVRFHTHHKYLLLAHSPTHYKMLGQLVAEARKYSAAKLRDNYSGLFMEALAARSTIAKNVNVLHHLLGFLKTVLNPGEKKSLLETVEDYRQGLVPLVVPLTLIRHYILIHNIEYVQDQIYLNPHPKEMMLRSHV